MIVAPQFEFLSLRMMLFLVPTFFLVFSMCALYDNVRSSVTPRYTGRLQWVRLTPFQLVAAIVYNLILIYTSRGTRWGEIISVSDLHEI